MGSCKQQEDKQDSKKLIKNVRPLVEPSSLCNLGRFMATGVRYSALKREASPVPPAFRLRLHAGDIIGNFPSPRGNSKYLNLTTHLLLCIPFARGLASNDKIKKSNVDLKNCLTHRKKAY